MKNKGNIQWVLKGYYIWRDQLTAMSKPLSTFERKMKNPKFKKDFEEGYKKLLFSELIISIMEGDDVSVRSLTKEAKISKSVLKSI